MSSNDLGNELKHGDIELIQQRTHFKQQCQIFETGMMSFKYKCQLKHNDLIHDFRITG